MEKHVADWLDYARRLVHDEQHRSLCAQALGVDLTSRMAAADLRWPGYVGGSYRPGGLLLVATVHREFASGRPPLPEAARDQLVDATRSWRNAQISDVQWLHIVRSVYMAGLDEHWIVGRLLRALVRRGGPAAVEVAYANAARCQIVENPAPPDHVLRKRRAAVLCASAYPISNLARVLRPGALVVTKGTWDIAGPLLPQDIPVFVVDQRQLVLRMATSPDLPYGSTIDRWAPALLRALR